MSRTEVQNRSQRPPENGQDLDGQEGQSTGHKLAEWVTLGVSILLVLALGGYLAYQAVRGETPFVPASVTPLIAQAKPEGNRYILPVEVENRGARTVRDFKGELTFRTPDGRWHTREFTIDFLGEHSKEMLYFYLEHPPKDLEILAGPQKYALE